MASRTSFFLNLSSTLLGAPRASNNGFTKVFGLLVSRYSTRLASQAVFGVACVCFSVPLFTNLYLALRVLWIQSKINHLNQLVDHRTSMHEANKRKLERILEVKEDTRKDMEKWMEGQEDLEKTLVFIIFDRELPQCSVDNDVDFDPTSVRHEQDEELLRTCAALKEYRTKIEEKINWAEVASKELNRSTDEEEKEMKRMQGELFRLLA
ncbi:hypothetical protein F5051DRAFT_57282 [Lentinula edodes]|nr:hypothetical protein F5051DRAFT_57282 [Lentinula edodes]